MTNQILDDYVKLLRSQGNTDDQVKIKLQTQFTSIDIEAALNTSISQNITETQNVSTLIENIPQKPLAIKVMAYIYGLFVLSVLFRYGSIIQQIITINNQKLGYIGNSLPFHYLNNFPLGGLILIPMSCLVILVIYSLLKIIDGSKKGFYLGLISSLSIILLFSFFETSYLNLIIGDARF